MTSDPATVADERVAPFAGPSAAGPLLGRLHERQALRELVESVRDGISRALVIVGEPGIGKTSMLQYASSAAADCLVAATVGVESESHLDFAALHGLLLPYLGLLEQLPGPQREALSSVFGLAVGQPPDRFRVSLAVLTLLGLVAAERPLLCIVDDVQWLDRASLEVLAFVCRRLHADSLGMVLGMRDTADAAPVLAGLPTMRLGGLARSDALQLITTTTTARVQPRVARRIAEETAGNPLALLEVVAGLTAQQLGGATALPAALPVGPRLEALFLDRVRSLPATTQQVLLVISAASVHDASVLWRAVAALGLPAAATDPAVRLGVLSTGSWPVFRHPLIRSAVYLGAEPAARRRAHAALAAATDSTADPDRRAWHLAASTVGHDEAVARELDGAALRSGQRGGYAAQAAFSLRAAELSADSATRAVRLANAGQGQLRGGDLLAARQRLQEAGSALVDPLMQVAAIRAEAFIEFSFSRVGRVPPLLLDAASRAAPHAPQLVRSILFEAMVIAIIAHHQQAGWTVAGVAQTALDGFADGAGDGTPAELMTVALATRHAVGYEPAVPLLRAALAALCSGDLADETNLSAAIPGCFAAAELWDDAGRKALITRLIARQRERDDLSLLHVTLRRLARSDISEGDFVAAERHHAEASDISQAIGMPDNGPSMRGELWAWQGKQTQLRALAAAVFAPSDSRRSAYGDLVRYAMAMLELSLRHYPEALEWALPIYRDDIAALSNAVLPEVVEAAVRSGETGIAVEAMGRLGERATASGTAWARGVLARCSALMAVDEGADVFFREAIAQLALTLQRTELARTHLLYGEWLRRSRRRADARQHLRTAGEMFDAMGATIYAGRARAELLATGERARRRSVETRQDLTAQESQVAGLAASGLTNSEIARQLYVTSSTVEYHLNKIFRKLGLTSRRQLSRRLGESKAPPI